MFNPFIFEIFPTETHWARLSILLSMVRVSQKVINCKLINVIIYDTTVIGTIKK